MQKMQHYELQDPDPKLFGKAGSGYKFPYNEYEYANTGKTQVIINCMRSSRVVGVLTANAKVATVLGSIPASPEAVESEGREMKQC